MLQSVPQILMLMMHTNLTKMLVQKEMPMKTTMDTEINGYQGVWFSPQASNWKAARASNWHWQERKGWEPPLDTMEILFFPATWWFLQMAVSSSTVVHYSHRHNQCYEHNVKRSFLYIKHGTNTIRLMIHGMIWGTEKRFTIFANQIGIFAKSNSTVLFEMTN